MRIKYHKEIEFFFKRFFFSEKFLLKRRLERAVKNNYEPEIKLIEEFVVSGTDGLDIGVYQGVYSYEISKYAKTVHAFECNPIIFSFLNRNIYKIINNIKLYNFGLSNNEGETTLRIPIRNKLAKEENYEEFFEIIKLHLILEKINNLITFFNHPICTPHPSAKLLDMQFWSDIAPRLQ